MMDFDINNTPLILFDGACNLCNKSVQFVLLREKGQELFFASLQSTVGQEILTHFGLHPDYTDSVLFLEKGKLHQESLAALKVCKYLKMPWRLLVIFRIIPRFLRDIVYKYIARNRIKWYGSTERCWIMTPEWRSRFL